MSELDWFNFETRMRSLIITSIEPLTAKQTSGAVQINSLQTANSKLEERIKQIESFIGLNGSKTGWMGSVERKIHSNAEDLKSLEVALAQEHTGVIKLNESRQLDLSNLRLEIKTLDGSIAVLNTEISEFKEALTSNKISLDEYFEKIKNHVERSYDEITKETRDSQTFSREALKTAEKAFLRFNEVKSQVIKFDNMIHELNKITLELADSKANRVELGKVKSEISRKIEELYMITGSSEAVQQEVLRYLDIYLPIEVDVAISYHLISFLTINKLKKWNLFHVDYRKELQFRTVAFEGLYRVQTLMKRAVDTSYANEIKLDKIQYEIRKSQQEARFNMPDPSVVVPLNLPLPRVETPMESIDTEKSTVTETSVKNNPVPSEIQDDIEYLKQYINENNSDKAKIENTIKDLNSKLTKINVCYTEIKELSEFIFRETNNSDELTKTQRLLNDKELIEVSNKFDLFTNTTSKTLSTITDLISCIAESLLSQWSNDESSLPAISLSKHPDSPMRIIGKNPARMPLTTKSCFPREPLENLRKVWSQAKSKLPFARRRLFAKRNSIDLKAL